MTRLPQLLRAMRVAAAANDPEDGHDANAEFHRTVIDRSPNRLLTRMTEGLRDGSIRHCSGRVLSQAHFRRRRDLERRRILQAVVQRNPDALEQAWRDHVHQSGLAWRRSPTGAPSPTASLRSAHRSTRTPATAGPGGAAPRTASRQASGRGDVRPPARPPGALIRPL